MGFETQEQAERWAEEMEFAADTRREERLLAPRYLIIWPQRRMVTAEQLITWARDDIANGDSDLVETQEQVVTVADAIAVLNDSGSVTFGRAA